MNLKQKSLSLFLSLIIAESTLVYTQTLCVIKRNRNMKRKLTLLALFLLTFGINAQTFNKAKMDSLFKRIESNEKGMGSISIFKNEDEIYQNSFGFADIENKIRATKKTKYRIGSVSKTFTATIIMQLIDEKKLSLYTKLADFYPEIPNAKEITIEQLLRHRSGLYNFTNSEDYQNRMVKPHSKSEVLEIFIENGTVFKPDEKAEYSNTNYVLLSYIAEKIEHKEYSEILIKRIIDPCSLKNTYYGGQINTTENEALSYTKLAAWELATETDMSVPVGAGGIVSNSTDLNIFYNHLFNGKLISDNSLNKMKKIVDDYGIGMFKLFDKKAYGHTGGIDEFQSTASYFPKDSTLIAYISNGVVMPKREITVSALKIYYNEEYTLPEFKPSLKLKIEDLDQYLGVYSSSTNPLKITISKDSTVLIAQATGQPSFPLEAYELHKFKFAPAMLKFKFIPEENKMILKQGGGEFELIKEE
ncbi:MAG: beta-lactamase family protein [Candidatus Marinimicrobia bacterium]|nr:beta-lactamase family protein [Candidatus Neomarinimicrobiota bacterium]